MDKSPGSRRFSVIVPVLNEAALITTALGRLQALRHQGHELILVDGGSSDATANLSQGLADRVVSCAKGRARQMNHGASTASGDVLIFLHVDTSLPPDAAHQLRTLAYEDQPIWGRFDVSFEPRTRSLAVIAFFMNLRSRLTGIATGDQGMFVERTLFNRVGGFPDIELMEDVALSKRLKAIARPLCLTSRVTTSGRKWINQGVARTVVLMWWLRLSFAFGGDPSRLSRRYYRL